MEEHGGEHGGQVALEDLLCEGVGGGGEVGASQCELQMICNSQSISVAVRFSCRCCVLDNKCLKACCVPDRDDDGCVVKLGRFYKSSPVDGQGTRHNR